MYFILKMVCPECMSGKRRIKIGEKKLGKLAVPDVWKLGARNVVGGKHGGSRVNMNVKLEKKKFR